MKRMNEKEDKLLGEELTRARDQRQSAQARLRHKIERVVLDLVEKLEEGDEIKRDGIRFRVEKVTWLVSLYPGGERPITHPVGALTLVMYEGEREGTHGVAMADVRSDWHDLDAQRIWHVSARSMLSKEGRNRTIVPAGDREMIDFSQRYLTLVLAQAHQLARKSAASLNAAADAVDAATEKEIADKP